MVFFVIHQSGNTFHQVFQISSFGSFVGRSIDNSRISFHNHFPQFSGHYHLINLKVIILQYDSARIYRYGISQCTVERLHSHK